MRRERVTGAEVGEEKETARRGEELRRRARRGEERKMGSRASIIHTRLPSQPFLSNTSYRARGPYRSWTVPLVDRTARGPYRSPTTRFASPYAIRASAGATDQIFTDPSSEHVAIECVSFGCHATQFTSSSCAPSTAPICRHCAGSSGVGA